VTGHVFAQHRIDERLPAAALLPVGGKHLRVKANRLVHLAGCLRWAALPRRNSSSVAFAPISPGSTSAAGRALAICFRVHSGLSASGREGPGFRVLLIKFFLCPVSLPEADNAKFILSWSDYDGVQATMQESQNTQAQFTVVAAVVLGGCPAR